MELSKEFKHFVFSNLQSDVDKLRLKYAGKCVDNFDIDMAITQIDCRQRTKYKLTKWIANENFLFSSTLSAEQSTSEMLAEFHASLVRRGDSILDITCGLGIDSMTFACKGANVTSIEINPNIAEIVNHNIKVCDLPNMQIVNTDSLEFLRENNNKFDIIFVDPARRGTHNQRTFAFEDCSPDIITNFDLIKKHCDTLLIKASPMLDITQITRSLNFISDIWILSIKNECKEVLIKLDFVNKPSRHSIHPINFLSENKISEIKFYSDREILPIYFISSLIEISPKSWLYEPNSSFMKTFAWDILNHKFNELKKLSTNTHLFVSDKYYEDFPGRVLKIDNIIPYKQLKNFKGKKLNIVARNAPLSPTDIKKRYKITDGGEDFLYICRCGNEEKPIALLCRQAF